MNEEHVSNRDALLNRTANLQFPLFSQVTQKRHFFPSISDFLIRVRL